jgi:hypothetical protein
MYMYSNDIDLNWCMGWIEILNVEQQDWFSLGTPVSSTNITDCHNIIEILLKVVLNTIAITIALTL